MYTSLDFVQRPVESATSVHVLPPRSLFLDERCSLLIAIDVLSFGTSKPTETHHGHHPGVVVHFFAFLNMPLRSIGVEVQPFLGFWLYTTGILSRVLGFS